jgi:hypothetical protein
MRTVWTTCGVVGGLLLSLAAPASAQSKFSGTQQCDKPDPEHTLPVGDRPDHALSVAKDKCAWTRGEIGGIQLKDEEDTIVSDIGANSAHDRGYGVANLANGDKVFVRFEGTTALKGQAPVSAKGTWSFTGGTGKVNGVTGGGTYTAKFTPDGKATFDIKGTYKLAGSASSE